MMLLGLVVLVGAAADSRIGSWLRQPGPSAVSASVSDISRVSISADTGLIRIATAKRQDLGVTLNGGDPGTVKVDLVREGSELQVRVSTPWWHSQRFSEPTAVEIWIPELFHPDALAIDVRTAKVEVHGVSADLLTYKGQTGLLVTDRVWTKATNLRLITGKIELTHHAGALRAQLTTGNLEVQLDSLSGPVNADLVTGQLVLDLPDEFPFTLDAAVHRGLVTNSLPLEGTAATGRNAVRGIHGPSTGAYPITLRVGTGVITIR